MPDHDSHPAALSAEKLLEQCELSQTRRSGPGGQHRNKVATAIVLLHRPTGIRAEANESRSQLDNRRSAVFRLRMRLALEVRRATSVAPSALWQSRCKNGRLSINPEHEDFPAILAEALDVLAAAEMDVKAAGVSLGCTSSQLTKLIKLDPKAFLYVNAQRENSGLRRLQ